MSTKGKSTKTRWQEFCTTAHHWLWVQILAWRYARTLFPAHDVIKGINILVFGDKQATVWHRKYSRHHATVINNPSSTSPIIPGTGSIDIVNKIEAVIDWESARYTKPDKPLTAYETWLKYYRHIDMRDTLKALGLWARHIDVLVTVTRT